MTGIAEMFAELDGYERYTITLASWSTAAEDRRRAMRNAHVQRWRRRHRAAHREFTRRWRDARPVELCSQCSSPRAPGKRACDAHLASDRVKAAARYVARRAA